MLTKSCPKCGAPLQALRLIRYEAAVVDDDGTMVMGRESLPDFWSVYCVEGHPVAMKVFGEAPKRAGKRQPTRAAHGGPPVLSSD